MVRHIHEEITITAVCSETTPGIAIRRVPIRGEGFVDAHKVFRREVPARVGAEDALCVRRGDRDRNLLTLRERLDAELEKGYNDMLNGRTTPWNNIYAKLSKAISERKNGAKAADAEKFIKGLMNS